MSFTKKNLRKYFQAVDQAHQQRKEAAITASYERFKAEAARRGIDIDAKGSRGRLANHAVKIDENEAGSASPRATAQSSAEGAHHALPVGATASADNVTDKDQMVGNAGSGAGDLDRALTHRSDARSSKNVDLVVAYVESLIASAGSEKRDRFLPSEEEWDISDSDETGQE